MVFAVAGRDYRSRLFQHVPRVISLCRRCFGWAQVHGLVENVASMDYNMSQAYGERPWLIDSLGASLSRWPRLYWVT